MTRAALTLALVAVLTAHPADAAPAANHPITARGGLLATAGAPGQASPYPDGRGSAAGAVQRSQPCNSGTYNYATINAPCVWDGRHRPGADSRSFVVSYAADFYYIRHVRAHCMLRAHEAGACPGGRNG